MLQETRQLAAIMFTDIVGYTALMAADEQKAMEAINSVRTVLASVTETHIKITKSLWAVGEQAEAIKVLEQFLITDPYHPEANYELALLFSEQGKNEKAIELLSMALDVWESADPEYGRARAAKDKYEQLTSSLSRISG